jgi:glycosyltransferase involved in cell wall biosynthesis
MARELNASRDWKALLDLSDLFRRRRFDVVHTHTPKAGLIGPFAARLADVPVVVHIIYGLMFHDRMSASRRNVFRCAEKFTAIFAHRLLSQSREDIRAAVATGLCSSEKISYIGNGIDADHFAPAPKSESSGKIIIGSVGRLVAEKGFPELFEAARRLAERNPNLHFIVVGPTEADQNDAIPQQLLDDLTRSGVVEFPGWGDDMRSWYARMDTFVLPSHREGIPRTCMEAASMGLPVIATDIRGCREVVKNGETGILSVCTRSRRAGGSD